MTHVKSRLTGVVQSKARDSFEITVGSVAESGPV